MDDSDLCTCGLHSAWHQAADESESSGWKNIMYAAFLPYSQSGHAFALQVRRMMEKIQGCSKDKCIENEGWVP